eukprot:UN33154
MAFFGGLCSEFAVIDEIMLPWGFSYYIDGCANALEEMDNHFHCLEQDNCEHCTNIDYCFWSDDAQTCYAHCVNCPEEKQDYCIPNP